MLAGLTAQLSRTRSDAEALPFAPDAVFAPASARGGVIWITGVAGMARADLVGVVRHQLEPWWAVEIVTPERLEAWLQNADEARVAIVVSHARASSASAQARQRVSAADLAFIEILAVSDWDALVERTDSTIFEHVADFFAHLGHAPAPRRCATHPEAVIRLDWHGPAQIERRIADALQRARLSPSQGPQASRHS